MNTLFDLQKTDEFFMESLITLLTNKPIHNISIRELCQKTGYNRSTFYYYFADIYDLETQTQDRLIEKIISQIHIKPDLTDKDFVDSLTAIYEQYGDTILFFSAQPHFYQSYKTALQPLVSQFLSFHALTIKDGTLDLTYDFILGGILTVLNHYYSHPRSLTLEQLSLFIQETIHALLPKN